MAAIHVSVTADHIAAAGPWDPNDNIPEPGHKDPVELAIAEVTGQDVSCDSAGDGPDGPEMATIGAGTTTLVIDIPGGLGQPAIEDAPANDDDLQLWSVTTIIGALDKPALMYWASEQTALAALNSQPTWRGMLADDDPDCRHIDADCPVVKWLRDARFRRPKGMRSASELGELVHQACEQYALSGSRPEVDPEVEPFLDRFDEWLQRFGPSYQATEVAVYHPGLGYAGTADAFLSIDGIRYIADYKTSRKAIDARGQATKPYPEQVGLQLAAYRHAESVAIWRPRRLERFRRRYYLLGPSEQAMAQPVPEVDTGLVIHITPEGCEAFPIVCDEAVFEAYLAVQDSARWLFQASHNVMGEPLVAPGDLGHLARGA